MEFKPMKTAVIGCGMISDIYLKNLKETYRIIDLVGCSDIISERSAKQAEKYGIPKSDIFVDCLVLTASTNQSQVMETLKAIGLVKSTKNARDTTKVTPPIIEPSEI